jgi:AAHS family 4-hydroxybenzoate transporter-like MFS transporter
VDCITPLVLDEAFACAALFIRIVGSVGANLDPVLPAVFCAGFCIVDGQAGANALVGGFYPTRIRATGVGWALSIGRIGSVVGPIVADWFLARGWKSASIFYCAVVPAALAGLAMVAIGRSGQRRPDSPRITMENR